MNYNNNSESKCVSNTNWNILFNHTSSSSPPPQSQQKPNSLHTAELNQLPVDENTTLAELSETSTINNDQVLVAAMCTAASSMMTANEWISWSSSSSSSSPSLSTTSSCESDDTTGTNLTASSMDVVEHFKVRDLFKSSKMFYNF